jgi:circadian clock protein KaiC
MRLSYVAAAGERNRALTIVKSRGTGHSNQVRELIWSSNGLSLVDVYTAGGAVLMGTLRRQKEEQERAEHTRVARAEQARHDEIASALAETHTRIASLRGDENRKKAELRLLKESSKAGAAAGAASLAVLRRLRGADVAPKRARQSLVGPSLRRTK